MSVAPAGDEFYRGLFVVEPVEHEACTVCEGATMNASPKSLIAIGVLAIAGLVAFAGNAAAVAPPWKNCAQVNKKYPHGVGKVGARDTTTGVRVTTFKRSNKLYALAMQNNRGLDRDKDGIACETE